MLKTITKLFITALIIFASSILLTAQNIGTGLGQHTIAAKADGTVYTWGYNNYGQLGNGNTGTGSNVPVAVYTSGVLSGKTITQVAAGYFHSIALASDATVYTWGYNYYGQLGNGNTGTDSNVPVAVNQSEMGLLPVELTTFTAASTSQAEQASSATVLLSWQTATEVNNYGFEIERQILKQVQNDNAWEKIGFVEGHGNSNSPKEYCYTDANPPSGKIKYRLKQIDNDGKYAYSGEVEVSVDVPNLFVLEQNYPNPFNPETIIKYSIPTDQFVTLKVFDMLGREITTFVNEQKEAGNYSVAFNGSLLSSGIYYYQLRAGKFTDTKKVILMK